MVPKVYDHGQEHPPVIYVIHVIYVAWRRKNSTTKIGYVICVLPKVRGYIWSDLTLSLATYVNNGSTFMTALATLGLSI